MKRTRRNQWSGIQGRQDADRIGRAVSGPSHADHGMEAAITGAGRGCVWRGHFSVREISTGWLQSYNEERPHESFAGFPPATYRARLEASSSPLKLSS